MGLIWAESFTWPPSGNHLKKVSWKRRMFYPAPAYVKWEAASLVTVLEGPRIATIDYQVRLGLVFQPPDRRPYDLDNRAKAVQDLLVKGGVVKDDNARFLNPVNLSGVDPVKGEPGYVIASLYTL